jgi:hypothetical protein
MGLAALPGTIPDQAYGDLFNKMSNIAWVHLDSGLLEG